MKNSKWVKLASKEDILKTKEIENFDFTIINLSRHFNIPDKRMSELVKFYNIEIKRLTKNKKLTIEEWKNECNIVHNNYFDYSMSEYKDKSNMIEIGCPIHGVIKVNRITHKNGGGCKRCSSKKTSVFESLSKAQFIQDATVTHDDFYDYSKVEDFVDTHEKITIICPVHKEFQQKVYSHRYGSGCEKCSYIKRGLAGRVSQQDYLDRVNIVHNYRYDYSKTVFTKMEDVITISCPYHNEFQQIAKNHLNGGCSACGKIYSAYAFKKDDDYIEISKTLPSGLYVVKFNDFYKIGITNNLQGRMNLIKSRMGIKYNPEIITYIEMSLYDAVKYENILHEKYKYLQHTPYISFEGQTECFELILPIDKIISYLKNN